jgi:murein DD-endopeptidase MepM/ murein hydrolase activator NlpD
VYRYWKSDFAGQKSGYGNCVIISHGNGLATLYAHLSKINVKANQSVKAGEVIAQSGNSGRSTGHICITKFIKTTRL